MKLETAIIIMENEMPSCGEKLTFTSEELYEAYQMAIEALKEATISDEHNKEVIIEEKVIKLSTIYKIKSSSCLRFTRLSHQVVYDLQD